MRRNPYLYAFFAVFCWSTVATAFKLALHTLHFVHLLFLSAFASSLVLFIILTIQGKSLHLLSDLRTHWKRSLISGLLSPFGYYLILFKAYSVLPAQLAQPLNYTWPIMLVIFSILFMKEKVRVQYLIGIFVSFSGVFIIASRGEFSSLNIEEPFGVFLAVFSSVLWAGYWILNMNDSLDTIVRMFFNFVFGFIFIGIIVVFFFPLTSVSLRELGLSFYIGIFEMGVTFVIWSYALQLSKGVLVANLVYLSPFISLIFIRCILGEKILTSSIIGLLFILAGIFIGKQRRRSREQDDSPVYS